MNKKYYQEPVMTVVELMHGTVLLQGSDPEPTRGRSTINDWDNGGTTDENIYM